MKEDATTLKENMEGYMEVFVGGGIGKGKII